MPGPRAMVQLLLAIEPRPRVNTPAAEELELMGDHYIEAEIRLSRADKMARGHVMAWSCNASGNDMGLAHMNPILDTRMYQVDHQYYCQNKCILMQCRWNGYLLLYVLVDYHKDNKAILLTDQQTSIRGRPVTCCQ